MARVEGGMKCAVGLSPAMAEAMQVAIALGEKGDEGSSLDELAARTRRPRAELEALVSRLAERGIAEWRVGADGRTKAALSVGRHSLADLARATGDWFLISHFADGERDGIPGLDKALELVRDGVLAELEQRPVLPFQTAV